LDGGTQQTKYGRHSQIKAFFNFISTNLNPAIQNACDALMLRRLNPDASHAPGKKGGEGGQGRLT